MCCPLDGCERESQLSFHYTRSLSLVLGERRNAMKYISWNFPVVTLVILGRTKEKINVPFPAFYQMWREALGLAVLKSCLPTTGTREQTFVSEKTSKSCWFKPKIGPWGPRYQCMGRESSQYLTMFKQKNVNLLTLPVSCCHSLIFS